MATAAKYHLVDLAVTPNGRRGDASSLARPGYHGPRRTTDYERMIAHAIMRKQKCKSGPCKSRAIAIARGQLNKAAHGRWGSRFGKGKAKPTTVAGALASRAQRSTFRKH